MLYLAEDGARQARLGSHLQSLGIDLHWAFSVTIAKQKLCEHKFPLLLVHFEHIRSHIFDFCKYTRHANYEGIILILMEKVRPLIESRLFDCGADDIAAGKQIQPVALKSRIKRRLLISKAPLSDPNKIMLKGGVLIDWGRSEVRLNGFHHRLKGVPGKLLRYFLKNPHRIISRGELIESHIWDNSVCAPDKVEGGRAIDMAITRLRRMIEPSPFACQIIITVHGTGWILARDAIL